MFRAKDFGHERDETVQKILKVESFCYKNFHKLLPNFVQDLDKSFLDFAGGKHYSLFGGNISNEEKKFYSIVNVMKRFFITEAIFE